MPSGFDAAPSMQAQISSILSTILDSSVKWETVEEGAWFCAQATVGCRTISLRLSCRGDVEVVLAKHFDGLPAVVYRLPLVSSNHTTRVATFVAALQNAKRKAVERTQLNSFTEEWQEWIDDAKADQAQRERPPSKARKKRRARA